MPLSLIDNAPFANLAVVVLHDPYELPDFPEPVNATIFPALAFLHKAVPQPLGESMFRLLRHRPHSTICALSDMAYDAPGGSLPDGWDDVVNALCGLGNAGFIERIPLMLPTLERGLLAVGPRAKINAVMPDGVSVELGWKDRARVLGDVRKIVDAHIGQTGVLNPGAPLVSDEEVFARGEAFSRR